MEQIKDTDVTLSSVQVYIQNSLGLQSNGVQVTNSAFASYQLVPSRAVSVSNGTVKASAGYFYGLSITTGGGVEIKDGNTALYAKSSLVAGDTVHWNGMLLNCATNISVSASSAVMTVLYA